MKNTEIASIILIIVFSFTSSFFLVGKLLGESTNRATVPTLQKIDSGLEALRASDFNDQTINPTVPIVLNEQAG